MHALRTNKFAVAAAPSMIALFALGIIKQAKLLAVSGVIAYGLSSASPVPWWLHAIIGEVLVLIWAVLRAEHAISSVTIITLLVAAIIALLLTFIAFTSWVTLTSTISRSIATLRGFLFRLLLFSLFLSYSCLIFLLL